MIMPEPITGNTSIIDIAIAINIKYGTYKNISPALNIRNAIPISISCDFKYPLSPLPVSLIICDINSINLSIFHPYNILLYGYYFPTMPLSSLYQN